MAVERATTRLPALCAAAALVALVAAVFAQVRGFGFVNLDDHAYVYANPHVLRGLTWESVTWALGATRMGNWHPLTWLSHLLDVELFGARAGAHHVVAVALHAANTLLLFAVLRAATGAVWRSALAAALFGIHPLHVESVAWISERKDVLSTLFLLLAMAAYIAYARRGGAGRYALVALAVAAGLMSKPMLVTAPLLLLILDAWPLARRTADGAPVPWPRLVLEKVPLAMIAAVVAVVTVVAQADPTDVGGNAVATTPLDARLANAASSVATYLERLVWPSGLASFYPHPYTLGEPVGPLRVATGIAVLAGGSARAAFAWRRRPYLAAGWLWYVVALLPVVGIVQVGGQAWADRYSYVPLIGPFVAIAWALGDVVRALPRARTLVAAAAVAWIAVLAVVAHRQTATWRDSITLHSRAISVVDRPWKSWQGLCNAYADDGRLDDALRACDETVRILPSFPEGWDTLGTVHMRRGDPRAAEPCFRRALALRPEFPLALNNLGAALGNQGQVGDAADAFRAGLRLAPEDPQLLLNLGVAAVKLGRREEALAAHQRLSALDATKAAQLRSRLEAP